jgi:hypothetical protein
MSRTPESVVLCVYRARHARCVRRLVRAAVGAGGSARLWALDERVQALERWTVGAGPGARLDLVNGLFASAPIAGEAYVVVADDDVVLPSGGYGRFLRLVARAGLDLAQPAHTRHRSNPSHPVTLRAPWSLVRLTEFVEIGPVFAVSPAWRAAVLPFAEGLGMGWGLEADWYGLHRRGARLGIVDAAPLRHLGPVGTAYAQDAERAQLAARLAVNGLGGLHEIQRTLATWRPWRRTPPW